jgi:hypothetical protein
VSLQHPVRVSLAVQVIVVAEMFPPVSRGRHAKRVRAAEVGNQVIELTLAEQEVVCRIVHDDQERMLPRGDDEPCQQPDPESMELPGNDPGGSNDRPVGDDPYEPASGAHAGEREDAEREVALVENGSIAWEGDCSLLGPAHPGLRAARG